MRMPGIGTPGFRPFEAYAERNRFAVIGSCRTAFALGVTLYFMAVGTLPWKDKEIQTLAIHSDLVRSRQWKLESPMITSELLRVGREAMRVLGQ